MNVSVFLYVYFYMCAHIIYIHALSDSEADGRVPVPQPARGQLPGLGAGGCPPSAAGRLLLRQDQCARRPERGVPALAGGSLPDCALHEGEALRPPVITSERRLC